MRNSGLKVIALVAALLGSLASPAQVAAQRYVTLVDWTNSWRYLDTGANPGIAWRDLNYLSESNWLQGNGILAYETGAAYPAPLNNVLNLGPVDNVTRTFYFRTYFTYYASNNISGLTLWASNAVDDGCVIFLNGWEVGRLRVPAAQTYTTLANGSPATEGMIEPLQLANVSSALRNGNNVVAVEVHQNSANSSDIASGMKLMALVPTAIAFTSQPTNQTVNAGGIAIMSATTSGGPVSYQWQTNNASGVFLNVSSATNAFYTNLPTVPTTISYRLIATNTINSVTSSVAVVTVVADTTGPLILSATVLAEATVTNKIELVFNESLLNSTVNSPSTPAILTNDTFRVVLLESNVTVDISNSAYLAGSYPNPGALPKVTLTMKTTNWLYTSNYYIILNNVRDSRTNVIAPNSIIPVTWPVGTNILGFVGTSWRYHESGFSWYDPGIYDENWWQNSYIESGVWAGPAPSPFYNGEPVFSGGCFPTSSFSTFTTVYVPVLFRTWFMWPTNGPTNVTLNFKYAADDAAAFFLNGDSMFRDSDPIFPPGPITGTTLAPGASANGANCKPVKSISNVALRPGSNLVAVALIQQGGDVAIDGVWALQLDAITLKTGPLPPASVTASNRLILTRIATNIVSVRWPTNAYGAALVYSTNIVRVGNSNFFQGPWLQEQPNMANTLAKPFTITNRPPGPRRFYELMRTQ